MLLDTAERARRGIEGEIGDTRESIGALTNTNALLAVDKRRLEGDIRCVLSKGERFLCVAYLALCRCVVLT